ncbi:MAG: Wzz/FepE/Etk N-terminal domain-containing protein, partial [Candidatus Binatia bacterium]
MKEIAPLPNGSPATEPRTVLLEEETSTDLRDYWFVIYRYRRIVLIFFLFTLLLTAISIPWGTPLYTATATLYIQGQTRGIFDSSELTPGANYQETQRRLLMSRSLVAQVITDLGLEKNPAFTEVPESLLSWGMKQVRWALGSAVRWVTESRLVTGLKEYLGMVPEKQAQAREFELGIHPGQINRYLEALGVTPAPDSYLVQVQFQSADPNLSRMVVNRHVATFISRNLATRFELTEETRQFLETKLVELKANVEKSERALNQFQRSHE